MPRFVRKTLSSLVTDSVAQKAMAPLISELSLAGLIARLREVEHLKQVKTPDEEQAAVLATETEVKKALFDELQGASAGLASFEKKLAKEPSAQLNVAKPPVSSCFYVCSLCFYTLGSYKLN